MISAHLLFYFSHFSGLFIHSLFHRNLGRIFCRDRFYNTLPVCGKDRFADRGRHSGGDCGKWLISGTGYHPRLSGTMWRVTPPNTFLWASHFHCCPRWPFASLKSEKIVCTLAETDTSRELISHLYPTQWPSIVGDQTKQCGPEKVETLRKLSSKLESLFSSSFWQTC